MERVVALDGVFPKHTQFSVAQAGLTSVSRGDQSQLPAMGLHPFLQLYDVAAAAGDLGSTTKGTFHVVGISVPGDELGNLWRWIRAPGSSAPNVGWGLAFQVVAPGPRYSDVGCAAVRPPLGNGGRGGHVLHFCAVNPHRREIDHFIEPPFGMPSVMNRLPFPSAFGRVRGVMDVDCCASSNAMANDLEIVIVGEDAGVWIRPLSGGGPEVPWQRLPVLGTTGFTRVSCVEIQGILHIVAVGNGQALHISRSTAFVEAAETFIETWSSWTTIPSDGFVGRVLDVSAAISDSNPNDLVITMAIETQRGAVVVRRASDGTFTTLGNTVFNSSAFPDLPPDVPIGPVRRVALDATVEQGFSLPTTIGSLSSPSRKARLLEAHPPWWFDDPSVHS